MGILAFAPVISFLRVYVYGCQHLVCRTICCSFVTVTFPTFLVAVSLRLLVHSHSCRCAFFLDCVPFRSLLFRYLYLVLHPLFWFLPLFHV